MAKMPVMGRVKTRLAADIGAVAATGFYRRELSAVLRRLARDRRWRTWVAVAPDTAVGQPFWPRDVEQFAQGPGDLGQRMGRVLRALPPGPAIVVGSDIPALSASHVAEGFALLGSHDAVFGPATDGGYYLVGLKRLPKPLDPFADIRWSGPHALADTLANLAGRRVAFVATLADIDTGEDLRVFYAGGQLFFC
ncbi:FIG01023433: hypothetical protein [hydrothermal vent metagenome]|uniref:Glycosyltransferase n=1 Tax=hydrothermal vent metagenome TaxID=652676 RepID=A0A3B0TCY4_9ZZZZ